MPRTRTAEAPAAATSGSPAISVSGGGTSASGPAHDGPRVDAAQDVEQRSRGRHDVVEGGEDRRALDGLAHLAAALAGRVQGDRAERPGEQQGRAPRAAAAPPEPSRKPSGPRGGTRPQRRREPLEGDREEDADEHAGERRRPAARSATPRRRRAAGGRPGRRAPRRRRSRRAAARSRSGPAGSRPRARASAKRTMPSRRGSAPGLARSTRFPMCQRIAHDAAPATYLRPVAIKSTRPSAAARLLDPRGADRRDRGRSPAASSSAAGPTRRARALPRGLGGGDYEAMHAELTPAAAGRVPARGASRAPTSEARATATDRRASRSATPKTRRDGAARR